MSEGLKPCPADLIADALDMMLEHWVQGTTPTDEQGKEATARLMAYQRAPERAGREVSPEDLSEKQMQAIDYAARWLAHVDLHKQIATPFPKETMRLVLDAILGLRSMEVGS